MRPPVLPGMLRRADESALLQHDNEHGGSRYSLPLAKGAYWLAEPKRGIFSGSPQGTISAWADSSSMTTEDRAGQRPAPTALQHDNGKWRATQKTPVIQSPQAMNPGAGMRPPVLPGMLRRACLQHMTTEIGRRGHIPTLPWDASSSRSLTSVCDGSLPQGEKRNLKGPFIGSPPA